MSGKGSFRIRTLAMVAMVGVLFAACTSKKPAPTAAPTTAPRATTSVPAAAISIGFLGALTGANAGLGVNIWNGVKLAVDQHNLRRGTQVNLVPYDSHGDPALAGQLAQKAITDHVVGVIGPAFSDESKAADPLFEQAGIANVTPLATDPTLATNGWRYWHRIVGSDNAQGPAAARYIAKKLNANKVAVIDDNSEYGKDIADIVRGVLQTGGATVGPSLSINVNAQDYSSTVSTVMAARVDAIFYGGSYAEAGRLLRQLRDAGLTARFVSDDRAKDDRLVGTAGPTAAEGAVLTCPCSDVSTSTVGSSFLSAYKAAFNSDAGMYSAEGYDAANTVLAAIDAGRTTPKDINDYLATASMAGITKTIKFDTRGEVVGGGIYAYEVKAGKIVVDGLVDQLAG
jgi:branched-chain amino acid transport system substrate-binding protein